VAEWAVTPAAVSAHLTQQELMARDGLFRRLVHDYGTAAVSEMQEEELDDMANVLPSAEQPLIIALVAFAYIVAQGTQVAHILWLGWWQSGRYPYLSQGAYQGIYAGIAVFYALALFVCNASWIALVVRGSIKLCITGLQRVMGSPAAFLDRTPVGMRSVSS
jgi:hypothetical protein